MPRKSSSKNSRKVEPAATVRRALKAGRAVEPDVPVPNAPPSRESGKASPDVDDKAQLLRALSEQIAELREMNVDILSRAAFIQAALDTLLTIHAGVDAGTRDLYASYFFSSRETIAAGMRHLGMQQALEDFLNRTRLVSEEDQAAAA